MKGSNHKKRSRVSTVAALASVAVLFAGCGNLQDKFFPTTVYTSETAVGTGPVAVSETPTQTEATTTTAAPTASQPDVPRNTKPTEPIVSDLLLEDFENLNKDYKIDEIVNELGPYARFECSGFYVWKLQDGTEAWINYPETDDCIAYVFHVDGLEETMLYVADAYVHFDQTAYDTRYQDVYAETHMLDKEFGPDLDRGYYFLKKGDVTYLIICNGMEETRGKYITITYEKSVAYNNGNDFFLYEVTTKEYKGDLPDMGGPSYPCIMIRFNLIPNNLTIQDPQGNQYICKGNLIDSENWGLSLEIGEDYNVVFTDGDSTYPRYTYMYKTPSGRYKYINAAMQPLVSDSTQSDVFVKGTDTVEYISDVAEEARRFGTYKYVIVNDGSNQMISADEYMESLKSSS